jgi:hypothetical protein
MVTTAVQDVEMKDADSPAEVDPAEQKKDADLAAIEGRKQIITKSVILPKFGCCMHDPHPSINNCTHLLLFLLNRAYLIPEIREHTRQIEKAVHSKEQRFILRVLRSLPNTRRRLNGNVLRKLISGYYTHSAQEKDALLAFVEEVRYNF